jgi:PAS domain S-box-containing protein
MTTVGIYGDEQPEKGLSASHAALKELADQKFALDQHAIVAITDVQGTITYVNEKFCAISGYSKDELIGQNHRILNSSHHPKEFFQQMYRTIANGEVWHGEIKNRAKDGSFYWVDTTIVPTLSTENKPRQYVAIRADITERKRSEQALKESLATSDRALKELADQKFALDQHAIVAITDVQGTITYVNDKFCAISQYPKEELIGQNHRILNSDHHPKEFFQQMYRAIASGKVWKGEIKNRAKGGEIYWVDTTIVPFMSADGRPRQYVAIRADITERKRAEEAAKESLAARERAVKELADQKFALDQHAIVAVTDVQGTITYVNDKFCTISHYSKEELIGQNHRILNSNHHPKEFFLQMYHTIAAGHVWHGEIKNRTKDGSIYWVDTTIVPTLSTEGKPRQYVAIRADITERKQAEEKVTESLAATNAALKELADQKFALDQHAIVAATDVQGRITYVNEKFCAISGYSKDELIGQNHRILNSGRHPKEFFQEMYHAIANGQVWHGEIQNRAKDGSMYWVDTTIVPFAGAEGKPRQYMAIRADITERKRSETRERLAAVVESSDDAIVGKSLDGVITAWNGGAEKLFGYSPAEVMGKSMRMLLPEERANEESDIMLHIARGESVEHFETVRVRKDGKRIDVSAVISLIRDSRGRIVGASDIARDISKSKADEREIRKLNDELASRVAELAGANQVLERSNIELKQFAYIASHDLQSPLRSISGFVQLIKLEYGNKLDEQAADWIRRTVQAVGQMQTLVRDLLAYSSVDSRSRPFVRTAFVDVFNDVLALLESSIHDSTGRVTCGDLPTVMGDRSQLVQLMQNLIGNGLKYHGDRPPHVHVSAERNGNEWILSVRDNGIGIDTKHYDRIFEIFKRLHDQKEYPGTGIGLAVCRRVVERHNGRIWLESKPGDGSVFHFTIPEGTAKTNDQYNRR